MALYKPKLGKDLEQQRIANKQRDHIAYLKRCARAQRAATTKRTKHELNIHACTPIEIVGKPK